MLWSQRLNPPLVSHKPLIPNTSSIYLDTSHYPDYCPMITPSHPILSHHISYGFITVFDAFDADHTPKATGDLCQLHLRQQIAWWKWVISCKLGQLGWNCSRLTWTMMKQLRSIHHKKKVDWAYKRWRFQQNWSNHETGVELTNMELLVKWSQLYHSETVEMKRKHVSYINQNLSESTVDHHHHHHHHHHHMVVPSNAGIFTLFRQFCKMDWAWEKQDHPKHQPGILSSFYMFLQHGK